MYNTSLLTTSIGFTVSLVDVTQLRQLLLRAKRAKWLLNRSLELFTRLSPSSSGTSHQPSLTRKLSR